MITHAHFQNFRALKDVTIELGRLTVLAGPNGSGKTSVLHGIKAVADGLRDPGNRFDEVASGKKQHSSLHISLSGKTGDDPWHAARGFAADKGQVPCETMYYGEGAEKKRFHIGAFGQPGAHEDWRAARAAAALDKVIILAPDPEMVGAAAAISRRPSSVGTKGDPIVRNLTKLRLGALDRFQQVEAALREVVPFIKRLDIDELPADGPDDPEVRHQVYFTTKSGNRIPPSRIGDGTLVTLSILTSIIAERPNIIMLDELERALHPEAIGRLMAQLTKLLELFPDLQIIATTHSPYVLNAVPPESVVLMNLDKDGAAHARRLVDHPQFAKWKESFPPGDLWAMFGEDWITEETKVAEGAG